MVILREHEPRAVICAISTPVFVFYSVVAVLVSCCTSFETTTFPLLRPVVLWLCVRSTGVDVHVEFLSGGGVCVRVCVCVARHGMSGVL